MVLLFCFTNFKPDLHRPNDASVEEKSTWRQSPKSTKVHLLPFFVNKKVQMWHKIPLFGDKVFKKVHKLYIFRGLCQLFSQAPPFLKNVHPKKAHRNKNSKMGKKMSLPPLTRKAGYATDFCGEFKQADRLVHVGCNEPFTYIFILK